MTAIKTKAQSELQFDRVLVGTLIIQECGNYRHMYFIRGKENSTIYFRMISKDERRWQTAELSERSWNDWIRDRGRFDKFRVLPKEKSQ